MNYMEIERAARSLSTQSRIQFAESLLYSLRMEQTIPVSPKSGGKRLTAKKRSSSFIQGILRIKGNDAPAADFVKDTIAGYLMEKRS